MNQIAYVSVFVRPNGTWTNAGIYSEFPCEQVGEGAWALLFSMKGRDFHTAQRAALRKVKLNYPWLRIREAKLPKMLG